MSRGPRPSRPVVTAVIRAALAVALALGAGAVAGPPAAADDPADEVLGPPVGEACLYIFVGLLITSGSAPAAALPAFEPALLACNQVPAAKERRYCQPDHYMFDEMNANSPNDIDTGPFGLMTDEVAALERVLGVPPQGKASPYMDQYMECVDRRASSGQPDFQSTPDDSNGPDPIPASGAGSAPPATDVVLSRSPLFSAAAGLHPGPASGDGVVASRAAALTAVDGGVLAAGVGPVPRGMSAGELVLAMLASLAAVAAVVRITLLRTRAPVSS